MLITKIFKVESSHRVVNCSSDRCKYSLHGHSAVIEITLDCKKPDNGGMGYDFGLMKGTIKDFIDSMDHCNLFYIYDDPKYIKFITEFNQRWISLPVSPSAEFLSAFIFKACDYIINHTKMNNGEGDVKVHSVKYHETSTGSATCFREDLDDWANYDVVNQCNVVFSSGVVSDWGKDLYDIWFNHVESVANPVAKKQAKKNW